MPWPLHLLACSWPSMSGAVVIAPGTATGPLPPPLPAGVPERQQESGKDRALDLEADPSYILMKSY